MDYDRFVGCISPHVTTMTHVAEVLVGRADAEDAAQEALLRDAEAIRAWLLRITVNRQRRSLGRQRPNRPMPTKAAVHRRWGSVAG
jgi:DNA-directed RNA polymerase specialized sigma24 family protein